MSAFLVPASIGRVRGDPVKALWLWGMLVPGLAFGIPALTPGRTALSLALTLLTLCLGHSVGLHRGIIHRSYETSRAVRGTLAWLFVLSGLGGPLAWARLHALRDHWQNRRDCPPYFAYDHGLARDFLWNLHTRFVPADARADARLPADVLRDPWLSWLERTWPLHVLALALVLLLADGPGAVAVCVCARTAAGILGHWFVGYAAHTWGERRHVVPGAKEAGTNVWLLGLISFGEGFHNNHHAFPRSARMGQRRHELDLGWIAVRLGERLGLVHAVRAWNAPGRRPAAASFRSSPRASACSRPHSEKQSRKGARRTRHPKNFEPENNAAAERRGIVSQALSGPPRRAGAAPRAPAGTAAWAGRAPARGRCTRAPPKGVRAARAPRCAAATGRVVRA